MVLFKVSSSSESVSCHCYLFGGQTPGFYKDSRRISEVLLILDLGFQITLDKTPRASYEDTRRWTWAHGLLITHYHLMYYLMFLVYVAATAVPGRRIPCLWLSFRFLLFPNKFMFKFSLSPFEGHRFYFIVPVKFSLFYNLKTDKYPS